MRVDDRCYVYVWKLVSGTHEFKLKKDKASFQDMSLFSFFLCAEAVGSRQQSGLGNLSSFKLTENGWQQLPVPTSQVCAENLNSSEALLGKYIKKKCFFQFFCYLALEQRVFGFVSGMDGLAINTRVLYYLWLIYNDSNMKVSGALKKKQMEC